MSHKKNNKLSISRIVLFYFVLSFIGIHSHCQTKTELINTIREDFRAINSDRSLTKETLDNDDFMEHVTDGGGSITGYFKNDSIVKIVEWIGLSYGNGTREFYFKKARLFFVYEKFQSFVVNDTTGEMDHDAVKTSFEGRYYFNKDKLIEQKTTGKRVFEDESADIVKELLASAAENSNLLIKKKK